MLQDSDPTTVLYRIEQQAHRLPWSEKIFMQSTGRGYRWRQLLYQGQISGFSLTQQIADELTLHNIAVAPQKQGLGLGKQLLSDVLAYAEQGQLTVFLEVRQSNLTAIALYTAAGFETVGRRPDYYPCEQGYEDALLMCWQAKNECNKG